ncbi:zinc ribbon domain-containing protein [Brevibacillus composti]|uniref:Zinc ribbon domain-containing protein n=1 Tax=Brevibacillus composti TaxID=2796470 RepID=A0A7T5ELZ6_9BACL|nr:zinc ribbon domain-containing protein [Brevibacillus composti]QQE74993.1 zinc ribbon domain-containing protein [Brevibacillus composti]QUO42078.1 zinc ribbon domain-containing protein [Brevibacillus composti]
MYQNKIAMIAANPKLVGKLCDLIGSMPNIDFPTMGGKVFWDTLAESGGWKLQKNKLTDHCRLIDPSNIRRAWGSERAMMSALERLQPSTPVSNDYTPGYTSNSESRKVFCPNCGQKVPEGRFCKECGSRMD